MVPHPRQRPSALQLILALVDKMPLPNTTPAKARGRKPTYSDRLFLKVGVLMTLKRLGKVHELLAALEEPTSEMHTLRHYLTQHGQFPARRTIERRLKRLAGLLPAIIAQVGAVLVERLQAYQKTGRAAAMDSTVLRAKDGAVWHKAHKEKNEVPHTRIDTEAGWTKSGWHGWVYGWKLHLCCTAGSLWIPLAARLTPADVHDSSMGENMVPEITGPVRFVLGDQHFNTAPMRSACQQRGMELVATRGGKYPHTDAGVGVRRVFHQLRSKSVENFNEHFKAIFDSHANVPTKGKVATARFVLGAVLVYQLGLWARHELGLPPNQGLKAFLKAV